MFSLIFSVGLSIILNALNFEVLAPLQVIFITDMGKQAVMDQLDNSLEDMIDEVVHDVFDF